MCKVFVQFALVLLMLSMTVLVLHYFQNLCRTKSMQLKDFIGRTTHTQTRTIQAGKIILISLGGNKDGKVSWTSNNINKTNNLGKKPITKIKSTSKLMGENKKKKDRLLQ
ncbi:hypothetical protein M9H77_07809 [Catharanthus roseus]|uniref:Uncharacterized protein n=1 Tax=Catharanthus roseus TaxID=4058 RepID=A0ACC0BWA6_CATRO|nr:hypothetical protein M9H77_07809 [Catharanthus roseus]